MLYNNLHELSELDGRMGFDSDAFVEALALITIASCGDIGMDISNEERVMILIERIRN